MCGAIVEGIRQPTAAQDPGFVEKDEGLYDRDELLFFTLAVDEDESVETD